MIGDREDAPPLPARRHSGAVTRISRGSRAASARSTGTGIVSPPVTVRAMPYQVGSVPASAGCERRTSGPAARRTRRSRSCCPTAVTDLVARLVEHPEVEGDLQIREEERQVVTHTAVGRYLLHWATEMERPSNPTEAVEPRPQIWWQRHGARASAPAIPTPQALPSADVDPSASASGIRAMKSRLQEQSSYPRSQKHLSCRQQASSTASIGAPGPE